MHNDRAAGLPNINGERLWSSLMELARIGATPKGGVCRLALTDEDAKARRLFVHWASEAGCSVRVDRIGNIFARRPGRMEHAPAILTGSHIDSQPTGGKFDGAYGVLAGLEVIRTLNDRHIATEAPIEVVAWTNEEGSRFVPVMMGSGVFAGAFSLEHALAAVDVTGQSVRDELVRIGYAGSEAATATAVSAYFEAHIEQGPVLERADIVIGVGRGVLGVKWYDCTITGFAAHAGTTPIDMRRDALQGAAQVMLEVAAIAERHQPQGRGTVGYVQVYPNSRNVIPGGVRFSIDLRNIDDGTVDLMERELRACLQQVGEQRRLDIELKQVSHFAATRFDSGCADSVRRAAETLGHSCMDIIAGAGHDAVYMARVAPSGMIFIPCKDGISHNEIEDAAPAHVTAGADVLLRCMLEYARVSASR
jgi:beta-ureidopropionase / N-carbamoyl-L-amino-acid hydrolase